MITGLVILIVISVIGQIILDYEEEQAIKLLTCKKCGHETVNVDVEAKVNEVFPSLINVSVLETCPKCGNQTRHRKMTRGVHDELTIWEEMYNRMPDEFKTLPKS